MAFSEIEQARVSKRLRAYCDARIPIHVRNKLRLGFRIVGHAVVLFEERPAFRPPHLPTAGEFETLLQEVDSDPTHIFWG